MEGYNVELRFRYTTFIHSTCIFNFYHSHVWPIYIYYIALVIRAKYNNYDVAQLYLSPAFACVFHRVTQIKTYSWDNAQVILVGNKCDMEHERVISYERGKTLADELNIEFFETSAKDNHNVKVSTVHMYNIIMILYIICVYCSQIDACKPMSRYCNVNGLKSECSCIIIWVPSTYRFVFQNPHRLWIIYNTIHVLVLCA